MFSRSIPLALLAGVLISGCKKDETHSTAIPTTTVTRGDISVRVVASGTVETIDPVDVKSKAGGAVVKLPVEIGNKVKQGELLVQIDPRDVQNKYNQAVADDVVTRTALDQTLKDQARKDSLYARKVITASEHDSTRASTATARSNLVQSRAALDLARQSLEDASIEAPISGTIVSRAVTLGTIVTPANGQAAGSTIMTIANLERVRMRVSIDEVEMGNIRVGQSASVKVDAFADRTFNGAIEKVEPQATVTQGVTFFPVLITIDNHEGLLMPGMSGEVTIHAADLKNVVQIPIDAIRNTSELAPVARMFGIPVDSIISQMRPDLVSAEGATAIPGRYVVVAKPDSTYEMRLVRVGPTDLKVQQIVDGVKEGDKVVMLGAIIMNRPTVPPTLTLAASLRRKNEGAPAGNGTPAAPAAPSAPTPAGTPAGKTAAATAPKKP